MNADIIRLTQDALWLVLILSAPAIVAASIVGLTIAFLQAATQLQEQTFSYTMKFFAIVVTLFVTAAMLGGTLYTFSERLFTQFPSMVR
ncbi:MAG: type III secretion system export apparatus subunit SctS [Rudaea sp.]|jgi:type III secretion protein S|uniref:type III secretion system export apparatus subunit SctS n=1 Tax=unclassified Rudaea TaxID=2627037 RepID=UPI0010F4F36C|nr:MULTISPECIES: type III secretion system export apparatus subunit SctS [unclassified Rudaea]MBN8887441.1 type III secretion system export apparatus subunit SctS [Rudaea sp.]